MNKKPLILIIDNDPESIKNLQFFLKDRYKIIGADSIINGLKILEQNKRFWGFASNKIKCIVINLELNVDDVLNFIEFLKNEENKKTFINFIPIIVTLSTFKQENTRNIINICKGKTVGFILNPINEKEISDLFIRAIDKKETTIMLESMAENIYDLFSLS